MTKLDGLIKELCPNGVKYKKIKDIFDRVKGTPITATKMKEIEKPDGEIKIFAGGKTVINANEEDIPNANIIRVPAVLVQSRGIIDFVYYEKPFTFKNEMWAYTTEEKATVKFLYYVFKNNLSYFRDASSGMGSMPQISLRITEDFIIPVPPLEVQREIVRILDNFTELTAEFTEELTAELIARKKQYEFYSNKLLCFERIPYFSLEELCEIVDYRGKTPRKVDDGVFLVTAKNIRKGYIDYEKSAEYIDERDYEEVMHRGIPQIGDVLITTEAPCGNVAQVDRENIALAQRVIKYRSKTPLLNNDYLKYILLGKEFQDKISVAATGGTVKGIKGSKLHKLTIPVPDIEKQKEIVNILKQFDVFCNNIITGLSAEIEARQKQYEYYRDKLLTFKELSE